MGEREPLQSGVAKVQRTWHDLLLKRWFYSFLECTSYWPWWISGLVISNQADHTSKRRQVDVFVLREQESFNHRKAKCSTSLHGIHHHRPLHLQFLRCLCWLTQSPTITCQWSMPPRQSSFSFGLIIPRASAKRWLKELFIKPGGSSPWDGDGHYALSSEDHKQGGRRDADHKLLVESTHHICSLHDNDASHIIKSTCHNLIAGWKWLDRTGGLSASMDQSDLMNTRTGNQASHSPYIPHFFRFY